jgi:3-methyladenine DNA glycosylase AlkC
MSTFAIPFETGVTKSSLKRLEDKYNKASTENKINFVTKKQSRSVDSFFKYHSSVTS